MPYIQGTPEALLPRSDSKNPNATCRGLTSTGRPCRRPLAGSPGSSGTKVPTTATTVDDEGDPMYCWQHKDQSPSLHTARPVGLQSGTIKERTSIDTLVDRLGIVELEQKKKRRTHATDGIGKPASKPKKEPGLLHMLCCMFMDDPRPTTAETHNEPPRPSTQSMAQRPDNQRRSSIPSLRPPGTGGHRHSSSEGKVAANSGRRPTAPQNPPSQTTELLSYIPKTVSPQVTSMLLTELAKPISSGDVPGYIYIFWLTDEKVNKPPVGTASTLLPPSGKNDDRPRGAGGRGISEVLQSYSSPDKPAEEKKLLLKIGRANNVQRRLNEWTRQCGYDVSLIRYYPYIESSSRTPSPAGSPSPGTGPRMVPNVHKVERLIHLELDEQRLSGKGKCERCGTLHKEWFEVNATREGLKAVDGTVRRWVEWAERNAA